MRARGLLLVAAVTATLAIAACGDDGGTASVQPSANAGVGGEVVVFAAASLTGSFTQFGKDFEAASPGTTVTFNFAGSSALANQINQGAPADVFASAAPANMATVVEAGNAQGRPTTFAKNQLVIAVPKGNPNRVTGVSDLAEAGVKVALCAEQVPCGAAAKKALSASGVSVTPVTQERDVKAALSKVTLGEVDAALVYRTDVQAAADDVDGVEFPESAGAINDYPIVVVRDAPNKRGAQAFLDYVRSPEGRAVLTEAGFEAPVTR